MLRFSARSKVAKRGCAASRLACADRSLFQAPKLWRMHDKHRLQALPAGGGMKTAIRQLTSAATTPFSTLKGLGCVTWTFYRSALAFLSWSNSFILRQRGSQLNRLDGGKRCSKSIGKSFFRGTAAVSAL